MHFDSTMSQNYLVHEFFKQPNCPLSKSIPKDVYIFGVQGNRFVCVYHDDPWQQKLWALIKCFFLAIKTTRGAIDELAGRVVQYANGNPQIIQKLFTDRLNMLATANQTIGN